MPSLAIFCLARSRGHLDRIIHELRVAEFTPTELGILFLDRKADATVGADDTDPRGLTVAASQSAGPIRGGLAWVAGISRVVIPGVGAFVVAGPVIAALYQAGRDVPEAAVARALQHLGLPAAGAALYERRVRGDGQILVSVHPPDQARLLRARDVFAATNALEICPTADAGSRPSTVPVL